MPALGMRLADPGLHDLPANLPVVQNLLATQRAFPGGPSPAEVVVTGDNLTGPAVRHAVTALQGRAATSRTLLREPVTAALLGSRPGDGGLGAAGRRRHGRHLQTGPWLSCATRRCPPRWAGSAASTTR